MKKFAFALTAIALVLTGCNNAKTINQVGGSSTTTVTKSDSYQPFTQNFYCVNGMSPVLHYPNDSQVQLTIEGSTTVLNITSAGSGSLYVSETGVFGGGGEWHQKGNDSALFSYKKVHGGSASVECTTTP